MISLAVFKELRAICDMCNTAFLLFDNPRCMNNTIRMNGVGDVEDKLVREAILKIVFNRTSTLGQNPND